MNVDRILEVFHGNNVACLLIGGMNYLLRHKPVLTYDVDLWIEDTDENLKKCEKALAELNAHWGASDQDWGPVSQKAAGWLKTQAVFCLTSDYGAIDVFRTVKGMESWRNCAARAAHDRTAAGRPYTGLSDEDMLRCEKALDASERRLDRIRTLEKAVAEKSRESRT